nr:hypothetical protein [Tanacetum cinerariifolium]
WEPPIDPRGSRAIGHHQDPDHSLASIGYVYANCSLEMDQSTVRVDRRAIRALVTSSSVNTAQNSLTKLSASKLLPRYAFQA